jgi:hypothetical protein
MIYDVVLLEQYALGIYSSMLLLFFFFFFALDFFLTRLF